MSLILSSIGHAHELFLIYRSDKIQITLHQPGHKDPHESGAATFEKSYQRDLFDKILFAFSDRNSPDYPDYILNIPLDKQPLLAIAPKTTHNEIRLIPFATSSVIAPPVLSSLAFVPYPPLSQPPPTFPPIPLPLSTTVLLN